MSTSLLSARLRLAFVTARFRLVLTRPPLGGGITAFDGAALTTFSGEPLTTF